MRESFQKYWIYFLAFIFFILGMYYYGKAYAYDHLECAEKANTYLLD